MYERINRYQLPRTVDAVADLLISDLLPMQALALKKISDTDFDKLYDTVATYIIDEFKLWAGNDELLASCLSLMEGDTAYADPAMVILETVREKLRHEHGVLIVT